MLQRILEQLIDHQSANGSWLGRQVDVRALQVQADPLLLVEHAFADLVDDSLTDIPDVDHPRILMGQELVNHRHAHYAVDTLLQRPPCLV